jgi:glutathione-regulated potassium-efflux system ancillary protein KefG
VALEDLIDADEVAKVLGLAQRNTVSGYQRRYADMPRPVVDMGRGRCKLWLRSEIQSWARRRQPGARGVSRH